jgi:hypothetical protein
MAVHAYFTCYQFRRKNFEHQQQGDGKQNQGQFLLVNYSSHSSKAIDMICNGKKGQINKK